jgi:hypothetical protein
VTSRYGWRWLPLLVWWGGFACVDTHAQIDPYRRDLIQFGYNAALQGHPPLAAYAFYYRNQPEFIHTNWTLRVALAPTYLDSELGISRALGEYTDIGVGLAGGGFADNYSEIRGGKYRPGESFVGYGGEGSLSVYHLFNPNRQIPLTGVVRGIVHYSTYADDSDTARNFDLPEARETFGLRTGLRWGGREPVLFPSLAMELSIWYNGQYRTDSGTYGFDDREVNSFSHIFWAQALLAYTTPSKKQSFELSLTAGTSIEADRFSAYRLGALLPLASEYPLSLPGYFYQELSADQYVLLSANYLRALDSRRRWNLNLTVATAAVDYLNGLEQPGNWHSGVGGGILYQTASWKFLVGYGYGVDAIRSDGRGAHSIGVLMQLDWGQAKQEMFNPATPNLWRGVQRIFGLFGQ